MNCVQQIVGVFSAASLAMILAIIPGFCDEAEQAITSHDISFEITAWNGEPFGVGIMTVTAASLQPSSRELLPVALQALGPNVFYPVVERKGLASRQPNKSDELRVYFLFDPDRAKLISILDGHGEIYPYSDPIAHRNAMNLWWKWYSDQSRASQLQDQYPAQLEQYLTDMLARRLELPNTFLTSPQSNYSPDIEHIAGFLTGTEAVRLALQKNALLGSSRRQEATEDLPKPALPPAVRIPDPDDNVEVEAIAMAVPPECFYARFTQYEDLVWFGEMTDQWGTELNGIVTQRGLKHDIRQRLQDQLNIEPSEIAKHLSSTAVEDYAIIGSDTFLREGAGIGILFHAKSNELLRAHLDGQRTERASKEDGVTLTELQIEGQNQTASLLSSPDNRVRSIYVIGGDFHLVTTSLTVARRFLEMFRDPTTSLGASKEFRYARTVTPLSRNDTAFIYLSDRFFRTFIDPAFRVEMTRRAASEAEIELVQLAILAATAEDRPHSTLDELITGGFLPSAFLTRADGSKLVLKEGRVTDSLRGTRGAFLPIPDVAIGKVTKTEAIGYQMFSQMYDRIWRWMDPATLAIQRHLTDKQERLVLDLHLYPYPQQEFGWLAFALAGKTQKQLKPIPGALLVAEANVLGVDPMIAGILDIDLPVVIEDDHIDLMAVKPENLPLFFAGPEKMLGWFGTDSTELKKGEITQINKYFNYPYVPLRYGYTDGSLSILATNRSGVEPLIGNLSRIDPERPANLRVHLGDIGRAKARRFLHAGLWAAANRVSNGNVDLLNRMVSQFHVPASKATEAAEALLGGRLVCPLGGDYQSNEQNVIHRRNSITVIHFEHPFLKRLRGAEFELSFPINTRTLISHAELLLDLP